VAQDRKTARFLVSLCIHSARQDSCSTSDFENARVGFRHPGLGRSFAEGQCSHLNRSLTLITQGGHHDGDQEGSEEKRRKAGLGW
jgi:hypothetical protein